MRIKRTCNKCGECCCSGMGPFVFPSDVNSISAYLHMSTKEFLDTTCIPNKIMVKNREFMIYSLRVEDGHCIFLTGNHLCDIFHRRPHQCVYAPFEFLAYYPFWTHMKCVNECDFKDINSDDMDRLLFKELIETGYQ